MSDTPTPFVVWHPETLRAALLFCVDSESVVLSLAGEAPNFLPAARHTARLSLRPGKPEPG